jgi:hypothetical protein
MNSLSILLSASSLVVLVLGFFAWHQTSSRSMLGSVIFGTVGFMLAAFYAASNRNTQMIFVFPFFITMILGGRGIAIFIRSLRGEKELRLPSTLLLGATMVSVVATISAYLSIA